MIEQGAAVLYFVPGAAMTNADRISLAGIVVSIFGFSATIWQLVRTARAAEATKRAVESTEGRLIQNHLLVMLPQFRLLELDLDDSVQRGERHHAIRTLVAFSQIASEIAGLLRSQGGSSEATLDGLEACSRLASRTKGTIVDNPAKELGILTKKFRAELVDLLSSMGGLTSQISVEAGRPSP